MAGFALGTALWGWLQASGHDPSSSKTVPWVASCACFGMLVGSAFAYDKEFDGTAPDRPAVRAVIGALSGLLVSLVWSWSGEAIALSTAVGSVLGYLGALWAKWVRF